jgi:hypothetical protein
MARAYGLRVLGSVEKPLTRDKLAAVLTATRNLHATMTTRWSRSSRDACASAARQRIEPWFQPQVELGNGKRAVAKRWRAGAAAMATSCARCTSFPLIEREGLVGELTDHMLAQACRWKHHWDQRGLRLRSPINISPQLLADESVADRYQRIVRSTASNPPSGARDHRKLGDGRCRARTRRARTLAAEGLRPVDRRLRHRLFLTGAVVADSVHRTQDRPGLRLRRTIASRASAR